MKCRVPLQDYVIAELGDYRGGVIEITAHRNGRVHTTGKHTWKRLEEADVL